MVSDDFFERFENRRVVSENHIYFFAASFSEDFGGHVDGQHDGFDLLLGVSGEQSDIIPIFGEVQGSDVI